MSTNTNKVVAFTGKPAAGTSLNAAQIAALTSQVKTGASEQLTKLFTHMFDHLDDLLFDLADKSDSGTQQASYFDAMRSLRMQRDRMLELFIAKFGNNFTQTLTRKGESGNLGELSFKALDDLLLVDDNDLEESLAVTNMVSKARNQFKEHLYALEQRLQAMHYGVVTINGDNNPLGPQAVCEAFKGAMAIQTLDLKVKLIVYKIFERSVVQSLDTCYYALNTLMAEAGVLPTIRVRAPVNPNPAGPATRPAAPGARSAPPRAGESGQGAAPSAADAFAALQELLGQQRHGGGASGGGVAAGGTGAGPGAGVAYDTPTVLVALSALQTNPMVDFGELKTREQVSAYLKTSIVDHLTSVNPKNERNISQADADTIDIVTMLFDFILDDTTLPHAFRALIARLQIPVLKVAIIDKSFFAKKNHPARRLLNELARAGIGWSGAEDESVDPLYARSSAAVETILTEFDNDVKLFESVLENYLAFLEDDRAQRKLAAEKLESSHQAVATEIERRIAEPELPLAIRTFLSTAWKDVLLRIHGRDGAQGAAWDMATQVADDLVWSVTPKNAGKNKARLVQMIPKLLNRLQDGLTLISYPRDDRTRLFQELEGLHLRSLKGPAPSTPTPAPASTPTSAPGAKPAAATPKSSIDQLIDDLNTVPTLIEDIVMEDPNANAPPAAEAYDEYCEQAMRLSVGTWVEFTQETGHTVRGKLAWKSEVLGEFTFVDRMYKLVADKTLRELADDIREQRARVVTDLALLDRALDAVASGLKRYVGGAQPKN
jgi:hypothetical protein